MCLREEGGERTINWKAPISVSKLSNRKASGQRRVQFSILNLQLLPIAPIHREALCYGC